jgi:hypothetical protein
MATRIALLGTGKMGSALARRLAAAGYELALWDRTADHAKAVGVGTVASSAIDASITSPGAVPAGLAIVMLLGDRRLVQNPQYRFGAQCAADGVGHPRTEHRVAGGHRARCGTVDHGRRHRARRGQRAAGGVGGRQAGVCQPPPAQRGGLTHLRNRFL